MTATVTVPYEVTQANITATNLALEPVYTSGESLVGGNVRRVGLMIYEFIGTPGTTHVSPATSGQTDWVLLGPANRYRPFDLQSGVDQESIVATQAENADEITYVLDGLSRVGSICFDNIDAATISIVAESPPGTEVYNSTRTLRDLANYGTSFYDYLTIPIVPARSQQNTDVVIPPNATISITISKPGGVVKVGAIIFGIPQELGATLVDASWSVSSYSISQFDGYKRTLLRLNPAKTVRCDIKIAPGNQEAVQRVMLDTDGIAAVWEMSDGSPEFTIYGVIDSATTTARTADHSFMQLQIKGV